MLNLGKLAAGPGAGRYYVDRVAQGREDYYSGEGEAQGVWHGGAAAALGLSGEVSEEASFGCCRGAIPALASCSAAPSRRIRSPALT
jgi:hypothetical protein